MSKIDSELSLLKQKIAILEERKRNKEGQHLYEIKNPSAALEEFIALIEEQKQIEEKNLYEVKNPLKVLEEFISNKLQKIEQNRYSKSIPLARFYDQEKVEMLEPILNALKNIHQRLDAIERGVCAAPSQPLHGQRPT